MFIIANNASVDLVIAIGGLWPIVLCITILILGFTFRDSLTTLLPKLKKIKSGNTEIEICDEPQVISHKETQFEPQESKPPKDESDVSSIKVPEVHGSFKQKLSRLIFERKDTEAEETLQQWDADSPLDIQDHKIYFHRLYCLFQKNSTSFDVLGKILNELVDPRKKFEILVTRSVFLMATDRTDEAMKSLNHAFDCAQDTGEKIQIITYKCEIFNGRGDFKKSLNLLEESISDYKNDHKEVKNLYLTLAETYKGLDDQLGRCAALEKAVESDPTDVAVLFDAAYAQSSNDLSFLALRNYFRKMQLQLHDGVSQNNYAVQLTEFGLLGKAVDFYEKSSKNGETLAASNLAYLLISKGFFSLAENILIEAQKNPSHHENVDSAMVEVRSARASENEKLVKLEKKSKIHQEFFRRFADARIMPANSKEVFLGVWKESVTGAHAQSELSSDILTLQWGDKPNIRKISGKIVNESFSGNYFEQELGWFFSNKDEKLEFGAGRPILGWLNNSENSFSILSSDRKDTDIELKFKKLQNKEDEIN